MTVIDRWRGNKEVESLLRDLGMEGTWRKE